ncbi:GAF domain-containing protein [Falsirhodobacter sp. 20TX0035]|uniref:GAF domain-containing protein n=1 Tax=Falsirhodobacter sp. 20TX0035 TaxID=3022019 RepID=UPI00232DD830|nr:GAF domain-containing protein [Falsirhodobacter sp. 20TX0035]MDB6454489.1 GAF domain-containing protein [Falsirhodobacter sp. 20TX0035]
MPSDAVDVPAFSFDERARSAALHRYGILDTPREEDFDDIAAIASEVCQTPIAVVNFIDTGRQFFKAEVGLGVRETPLDTAFCARAILCEDMMIVPDALQDPRFEGNPLVHQAGGLRFYAGALLKTPEGLPIGTVCVLDRKPRNLDAHQVRTLRLLARQAMTQVELRASLAATQRLSAHHRQVIDSSVDYAILSLDLDGNVTAWNQGARNIFGWSEAEMLGRPGDIIFNPADRSVGIPDLEMEVAKATGRGADERWHVRKDGSRFFALGEMMLLKDDAGQHVGYVKILRDRTHARRQAQRLALLSEASAALLNTDDPGSTLRPILEGGTDTIGFEQCYVYDIAAEDEQLLLRHSVGVTEETRMALSHVSFDVPLCGIVAQTAEPVVLSDLAKTEEPRHQIARITGMQAYAGFPICVRDRAVGVISFGSVELPAFDDETLAFFQTIARFLSVARERADDAQALRDAEQRSRLAQEAGGIGTFEIEVATGTVVGSSEFFRIFGVTPLDKTTTRLFQDIVVPEDREAASRDARHPQGMAPADLEYRIRRADDGKLRWIARRAEYIRDDTGHIRSMCGTVQDITDKKIAALRQEALLELGNSVRHAARPEEMIETACHLVLRTLDASRAGYAVVDRRAGLYVVTGECLAPGVPSANGRYELSLFEKTTAQLETGQPLVLCDAEAEARLAADAGSYHSAAVAAQISVPQMRKDELVGALFVHQTEPRDWTAGEVDFMRRVADRLYAALATARAEKEQAVLNHELSHRLKNSLSMVQAVASQTLRGATDQTALQDFLRRMQALSAAHDVLLHRNWEAGSIRQTIQSTLATLAGPERLRLGGPDIELGARSTLSLSMLLHELATNAVKYGCLSADAGTLLLAWEIEDVAEGERDLVLVWQEAGGPEVRPPTRKGFGSRLIQMGLTGTGGVELSYEPSGFIATIRAPLSELQSA